MFEFKDFDYLTDEEIDLIIDEKVEGNEEKGYVPAYKYKIYKHKSNDIIGEIDIRIGNNQNTFFGGNIGYAIEEVFRGNGYASKACKLIKIVAKSHGVNSLFITCNPDNWASRKTCEKIGARFIELIVLPEDNEMYLAGEKQKCVFKWEL
jgi:tagatose 1,6-diphosphate aldolase